MTNNEVMNAEIKRRLLNQNEDIVAVHQYFADHIIVPTQRDIERASRALHNAGLDAFSTPDSKSAYEWENYRQNLAKELLVRGSFI